MSTLILGTMPSVTQRSARGWLSRAEIDMAKVSKDYLIDLLRHKLSYPKPVPAEASCTESWDEDTQIWTYHWTWWEVTW